MTLLEPWWSHPAPWKRTSRAERRTETNRARSLQQPSSSRRIATRDEGNGGRDGIVLSLKLIGDGVQESVYTLPISLGSSPVQNFHVQVDTGSSDLWLASKGCTASVCSGTKLYDPSSANATGKEFDITYLKGDASGPIYWDELNIGGYNIGSQALAAVTDVDSEPLDGDFSGVLGLALASNSIIQQQIGATSGNAPDGATVASNIFGITPDSDAPAARFLSIALERPGMDDVPSVLGIGHHPSQLVSDPGKITYTSVIQTDAGFLFWQSIIRNVTVYVNGTAHSIPLPRSTSGAAFPTAVLDTGVPFILMTTPLANAIYGAIGIGPGSDGQYYVPCSTPINMSITLYEQKEQPLHPLDLTAVPSDNPNSDTCVGMIQTAGGALDSGSVVADVILGVPFLRNTYFVMAFDQPFPNGSFPNAEGEDLEPHLGLLNLLNVTQALDEFNQVRVLGEPLASSSSPNSAVTSENHGMSIGIKVLIGIISFVGLCALLFGGFFILMRRRWRARVEADIHSDHKSDIEFSDNLSRPRGRTRDNVASNYTDDTARTRVGAGTCNDLSSKGNGEDEAKVSYLNLDPWDASGWRTTVTSDTAPEPVMTYEQYEVENENKSYEPVAVQESVSQEPVSPDGSGPAHQQTHLRTPSDGGVTAPLIAHTRDSSRPIGLGDIGAIELGMLPAGERESMAGIGTAARGRRLSYDVRNSSLNSPILPTDTLVDASLPSPRNESFAAPPSPTFSHPGRPISPRPISLNARFPALADVPASDFEFLARRSHAFTFHDPPTPTSKRSRKS